MYPTTSDGRYFLACWYSDRTPEHGRLPRLSPFTCAFIPSSFMVVRLLTQNRIRPHCQGANHKKRAKKKRHSLSGAFSYLERETRLESALFLLESIDVFS